MVSWVVFVTSWILTLKQFIMKLLHAYYLLYIVSQNKIVSDTIACKCKQKLKTILLLKFDEKNTCKYNSLLKTLMFVSLYMICRWLKETGFGYKKHFSKENLAFFDSFVELLCWSFVTLILLFLFSNAVKMIV